MGSYKRLWWSLFAVILVTFAILGWSGVEVYKKVPPIPTQVLTESGTTLTTKEQILDGQSAWQSTGGMELGSVMGHGAYQAPDWTADWLHRELVNWLEIASNDEYGQSYDSLRPEQQAGLERLLSMEYRKNTVDENNSITITDRRAKAIQETAQYYIELYGNNPEFQQTRSNFAMKNNTLPSLERRQDLAMFYFWTAWASATERPDETVTYTNNWPHEKLIDNHPSAANIAWSLVSLLVLLAGIGFLVWAWAFLRKESPTPEIPTNDPISMINLTPSQKALGKYLLLTVGLFIFQVLLGGFTAHYTVSGQSFYGIDLSQWFPYSLTRSWHLLTAVFWIATGFLAAGLFLAPIINGGKDPKYQKLGVNILFWALVVLVVGAYAGQFFAIKQVMPPHLNFWFGHQGYEYVDLGRFWQIIKFIGLLFWLLLMLRGMLPAFKKGGDKNLLALFTASTICIGLFYGLGLFYGERTHITIMEYWRWWVVHLWVEGIFEVFATVSLAFIFSTMGLVSKRGATAASIAASALFLLGGVPGTLHHLYFSGTSTPVMAIGATFSALEVVPLVLLGYEAWDNWRLRTLAPWMEKLRWPLICFVTVAFWNMLGAGVFGFMVNPPIALYYIQGLNTTPVHAHAAFFGVYGFLSLGFVLMVLRYIVPSFSFNESLMRTAFWCLNGGLLLMIFTSLLPIGFIQFYASLTEGMWYARSEEFMQTPILQTLRWVRTIGDMVFIVGAFAVAWQVFIGVMQGVRTRNASAVVMA